LDLCEQSTNRTTTQRFARADRLWYLATRRDGRGSKQNLATTTQHARNRAATGEGLDGALVHGAAGGGVSLLGRVCFRVKLGLVRGYLTSFFLIRNQTENKIQNTSNSLYFNKTLNVILNSDFVETYIYSRSTRQ
jgi:hypothetical protein